TVNVAKMIEIMHTVPAKAFMLQTNGTLIHRIPKTYYSKFNSILLSIDGNQETTDYYRGEKTYERIIENGKLLRDNGFTGDLVARMTTSYNTNIFKEVLHLLNLQNPKFDHIHWQLDVMWDTDYELNKEKIMNWIASDYNPGITELVNYWVDEITKNGIIEGIAPFLGITYSLLTGEKSDLKCGAGKDFFAITTDGRITMCPILPSYEFIVGDIKNSKPEELVDKISLGEPCISCDVRDICGGRCLYTNKTKYWGDEGFDLVCSTVKHLINELRKNVSTIKQALTTHGLEISDFKYPVIPNGVEIIP
ncbi:MAG: TIGR04084 family radical SAM/SPASM domain-containing protein, partial [Candidatus Heimdallarchaeota archaeon]